MKTVILMIAIMGLVLGSYAQNPTPPAQNPTTPAVQQPMTPTLQQPTSPIIQNPTTSVAQYPTQAGQSSTLIAQNVMQTDVPPAVVKSFNKKNTKIETVAWSKTGDFYKASFTQENIAKSVSYDAAGKVKHNEMQVSVSQLPTQVLKYVNDNYPSDVVKKSSKVTNAAGKSTYILKVKDSELVFDSNGKYMEPVKQ